MSKESEDILDKATIRVLRPVIESMRAELRDLDTSDIPAGMVQVAKRSDNTLPPPIARSVIQELITNDSLRDAVRLRLAENGPTDPSLSRFFDNPADGLAHIAKEVLGASGGEAIKDLKRAQKRIAALERELEVAKARLSEERAEHALAADEQRATFEATHQRSKDRNVDLRAVVSAVNLDLHDREARISDLETELEIRRKKTESHEGKREKRSSESAAARAVTPGGWSRSDPLDLARRLDVFERTIRPYRPKSGRRDEVPTDAVLSIPYGIAPDSPDALASLIAQSPRRIIIDGYNVSGELHGEKFSTREAREEVLRHAGSLARRTRGEVLVVFDGPATVDETSFRTESGVNVSFSRGTEADDVIESLVMESPERTVVVTNDNLLRERCTVDGCVPIWSTALLQYLGVGRSSVSE